MNPEESNQPQSSHNKAVNDDFKSVMPRPHYLLDQAQTPVLYWTYAMGLNETFEPTHNEVHANPARIGMALISIFNGEGRGVVLTDFLDEHYKKYCGTLMADELGDQPFFDFLNDILKNRIGEFTWNAHKALNKWLGEHDYYRSSTFISPLTQPLPGQYDQPNKLSLRQIALILVLQELKSHGEEAKQLMHNSPHESSPKMIGKFNELHSSRPIKLNLLDGSKRTHLLKDFITVYPYLTGPAKQKAEKEILSIEPEIKLPV